MPRYTNGGLRTTVEVGSLFQLCESQESNSGHQIWWQVLLPSQTSYQFCYVLLTCKYFLSFNLFSFVCLFVLLVDWLVCG